MDGLPGCIRRKQTIPRQAEPDYIKKCNTRCYLLLKVTSNHPFRQHTECLLCLPQQTATFLPTGHAAALSKNIYFISKFCVEGQLEGLALTTR